MVPFGNDCRYFNVSPFIQRSCLGQNRALGGQIEQKARRRATINLSLCFPEKSDTEREIIVDKMFATALQSIVMMAELAIRGPEKFQKRVFWKGLEILEEIRHNNRNVIFLVPHGWSVDIPAMLLAAQGEKMAAMFHQQRNPVIDYIWNSVRRKFGGAYMPGRMG